MKDFFKTICIELDWHFEYGRSDFHNLSMIDTSAEYFFFLDPIEESISFEYATAKQHTYSGRFMLLMKSDFDRVYNEQQGNIESEGKYEMYIKKCKEKTALLTDYFCKEYDIQQWKIIEVINVLDENFDGVLVNFQAVKI